MKRRISILAVLVSICTLLCGCSAKHIKDAKEAFAQKRYEDVVEALDGITVKDTEVIRIQAISEAYISYENEDHQRVVDLLGKDKSYNNEQILMESWEKVFKGSAEAYDTDTFLKYAEMDYAPAEVASDSIIRQCDNYDYDMFLFLDQVTEEVKPGSLKTLLKAYSQDHGKTRTKAFLKGTWEIQSSDDEVKTRVDLYVSDDDAQCMGTIIQTDPNATKYRFYQGEAYWNQLVFEGDQLVSLNNLAKTQYGRELWIPADVTLFFENDTMCLQFDEINWFYGTRMISTNATWMKISKEYGIIESE